MNSQSPYSDLPQSSASDQTTSTEKEGANKKKKILFGGVSLIMICLVAGVVYGLLAGSTAPKANVANKAGSTQKAETPQAIDSTVQSTIASEQKAEGQTSDAESQAIVDDVNTTQAMEENYDDF